MQQSGWPANTLVAEFVRWKRNTESNVVVQADVHGRSPYRPACREVRSTLFPGLPVVWVS